MASVFKHGGKGNRDGYYYVAWRDHRGKRHTKCTRTTDKAAAERIAAKYETDAALRRDGVIDPMLDDIGRQSQRPLSEHIADYKAKLQSAGRTAVHTDRTTKYIKAFAAFCKFDRAADITADGAHQYAQSLTDKQRSARTVQAHLTAAKGFTKWLSKGQKLLRDPLESVSTPSPEADRSFERRILLPEEWYWLRANTSTSATRQGMAGAERVLLYSVAIQTGLRSGELRSLTRGRLFLSEDRPYIVCKARSTKNRKDARQYIQRPLAAELQSHVATKAPGGPLFVLPAEDEMASMLRADLADARRAWLKETLHDPEEYTRREQSDFLMPVNHDKERLDFHSLRHTCGAWLAKTGAHPKAVQTVMRHSTITLTMDTYGHLFPGEAADTVARLADLMGGPPAAMQATGTNDAQAVQRQVQRTERQTVRRDATVNDGRLSPLPPSNAPKLLPLEALRDEVRRDAIVCRAFDERNRKALPERPNPQAGLGDESERCSIS